jgi:hypothetical protein
MAGRLSPASLNVIRIVLVSDALLMGVLGALAAAFVDHPAGWFLAGGAWTVALVMFACLPLTDPYRYEERRRPRPRVR